MVTDVADASDDGDARSSDSGSAVSGSGRSDGGGMTGKGVELLSVIAVGYCVKISVDTSGGLRRTVSVNRVAACRNAHLCPDGASPVIVTYSI